MKIASFNINGIKARAAALPQWLDEAKPDVVVLQEIKSIDEAFPRELFEERGYNVETHGQKGFNGVAILSKLPLEDVSRGLPGDEDDLQARWIEATVIGKQALRICGLYLPNGNPVELTDEGSPVPGGKYAYKLAWMERLHARAQDLLESEMPALMAGDYNRRQTPRGLARGCIAPPRKPRRLPADRQSGLYRSLPGPAPGAGALFLLGLPGWRLESGRRYPH